MIDQIVSIFFWVVALWVGWRVAQWYWPGLKPKDDSPVKFVRGKVGRQTVVWMCIREPNKNDEAGGKPRD